MVLSCFLSLEISFRFSKWVDFSIVYQFRVIVPGPNVFIFRQWLVITLNCRVSSQLFIWSENIHVMMFWRNCGSCEPLIVFSNKSDLCSLWFPVSFSFNLNISDQLDIVFAPFWIVLIWLLLKMTVSHVVFRPCIVSVGVFLTFVRKIRLHSIYLTFIVTLVLNVVIYVVFHNDLVWKLVIIRRRKKLIFKF